MIQIVVPGPPCAQPRQRHRVVARPGAAPVSTSYVPKGAPVNAYKATLRLMASQAHQGRPLEGPLALRLVFVMPRPQSKVWKRREMAREPHAGRPDVDNLVKACTDSLNQLLWRDDAQIARVVAEKWIAAGDEQPHTLVEVSPATC